MIDYGVIYGNLLDNRIIILDTDINPQSAMGTINQLLYLDSLNNDDITLYINSGGGSVKDGLAIIDTMDFISSAVKTICIAKCYSMAALILMSGSAGKRGILKNSEVMIHQPWQYLSKDKSQLEDLEIITRRLKNDKDKTISLIVDRTGRNINDVSNDINKDTFLNSKEALEYNIVDYIINK